MRPSRLAPLLWMAQVGCAASEPPATQAMAAPGPTRPAATQPASAGPLDEARRQALRALLAGLTRPPLGTGAALALSLDGQLVVLAEGTLRDGGPAVGEATRFNVASVSKLLTAAMAVSLAHAGTLRLDDNVRAHLPGLRLVDPDGGDRAGEITVRQLLMHRGGLPHQPPALDPKGAGTDWTNPALLAKLTTSWSVPLRQAPGAYSYSNLGYALLAAIVEQRQACDFAECMQPFLHRLGMRGATFWPATLDGDAAHGRVEKDGAVTFLPPPWYGSRYALPFSGLWTSMPDLARFGEALVAAHAAPDAPLHAMTQLEGERGHGLGPVHRPRLGSRSLEHDGGGPGFTAWLLAIPGRRAVLALACNANGETGEVGRRVAGVVDEMLDIALGEAPPRDAPR